MSFHDVAQDEVTEGLLDLTQTIVTRELAPIVADVEESGVFPREVFRVLGRAGLLSLTQPAQYGGAELPTTTYLQVLERLGAAWASVAVGTSVHGLATYALVHYGTDEQKERLLPELLSGELLGAYCLSEAHAGSDAAAIRTRAVRDGDDYVITGAKAWITHGGEADFYTVMARTSDEGGRGISCFHVPASTPGVSALPPERKMGLRGSTTATVNFDGVRVPAENRIGEEGMGLSIALSSLNAGRLGIAAIATGLAQGALDLATEYARGREAFGVPIIDHDGLAFLLADMDAAVFTARAAYLLAADRADLGLAYTREASIAKLVASDNAMRVTTDAVQVLGGAGYTQDFPAERYMREAKIMQIFEGTNQIQRLVIARGLRRTSRP